MKCIYLFFCFFLSLQICAQELQFGPQSRISSEGQVVDDIALIVNKQALSRSQLTQEMLKLEKAIPPEIASRMSPEAKKQAVLENIISKMLVEQAAKEAALKIEPAEVDKAIAEIAAQNRLSKAQLLSKVALESGMDEQAYRQTIAEQITHSRLQESIVGSQVRISEEQIADQVAHIARKQGSTMHLQDLLLPLGEQTPEERGQTLQSTLASISSALKKHNNDLQAAAAEIPNARFNDLGNVNVGDIPMRFARAVINLNGGQILENPVIDNDGMHFLKVVSKTAEGGQYVVTNARAAHILLRRNPQNPSLAQTQIKQIYAALQGGANFAQIAARYSQDSKSAVAGGELGWIAADSVDPKFGAQLSTAPIGTITPPFETSFGWHILLVHERHNIDRSEEMMRLKIRENLFRVAMQEAWEKHLIELRRNAYIELK